MDRYKAGRQRYGDRDGDRDKVGREGGGDYSRNHKEQKNVSEYKASQ